MTHLAKEAKAKVRATKRDGTEKAIKKVGMERVTRRDGMEKKDLPIKVHTIPHQREMARALIPCQRDSQDLDTHSMANAMLPKQLSL